MSVYIGEPVSSTLVFINEFFMIIPKEVQNRSLKIMNMHRIFNNVVTEFIRFPIHDTRFYTTASHPDAKAPRMMIATIACSFEVALTIICAAEFTSPDDECLIKHAPVLKIPYQCR